MPVAWNKCLEDFFRHASECTHTSSDMSFKGTHCDLFSFLFNKGHVVWNLFQSWYILDFIGIEIQKNWPLDLPWHCLLGPSEVSTISKPSVLHCAVYSQMKTVIYVTVKSHCTTMYNRAQFTHVALGVCNGTVSEHTHNWVHGDKTVAYESHFAH